MFRLDMQKVNEGTEVLYHEFNPDDTIPSFIIANTGSANKQYQKAMEAAMKPHRKKLAAGILSEGEATKIMRSVFIDTCLRGWSNFQPDGDGVNVPFSPENAERYLGDPELTHVYEWLTAEANNYENYRKATQEAEAGN